MSTAETIENAEQVEVDDQTDKPDHTVNDETDGADNAATGQHEEQQETDEVVVTIGDEQQQEEDTKAPEWVRELRVKHREAQKRIRELESIVQKTEPATKLGAEPKLEDFDYDADKFTVALKGWYENKRKHDAEQEAKQRQAEEQEKEWRASLQGYNEKKQSLKVKDFDDAEEIVKEQFNVIQQSVILDAATNSALVVYALGKNPKKSAELASIKNPVKLAAAIANLESQLKVQGKRTPPAPEKTITGTAPISGNSDQTLERLREEAARTGDMSKVVAYKRQLKEKQK
jgi:hypothetical protein